jgi:hypothetical protein
MYIQLTSLWAPPSPTWRIDIFDADNASDLHSAFAAYKSGNDT